MRVIPKKPPIALVNKEVPDEVVAYACGTCGTVCALAKDGTKAGREDHAKKCAEGHCPKETFCDCGTRIFPDEPYGGYQSACKACRTKKHRENLAARREDRRRTAISVGDTITPDKYKGPVYWEERDTFFSNFDEAAEAIRDDAPKESLQEVFLRTQTLWTCTVAHLELDANAIIENAIEAMDPPDGVEIEPSGKAMAELRDFIRHWNAVHGVNAGDVWWESNQLIMFVEDKVER